ncbi:MAG: hypothetical protein OIF50_01935 [Flavobacteriaceae bacterium]|nr:hypothetical protein [Flavobacteriaceae bacterium]
MKSQPSDKANVPTPKSSSPKKRKGSTRIENRMENLRVFTETLQGYKLLLQKEAANCEGLFASLESCKSLIGKRDILKIQKTKQVAKRALAYKDPQFGLMCRLTTLSDYLMAKQEIDVMDYELAKKVILQMRNNKKKQLAYLENTDGQMEFRLTVTQRTSTYGFRLEGLRYLLQIVEGIGKVYDPGNKKIQKAELEALHARLEKENALVAKRKSAFSQQQKMLSRHAESMMEKARDVRRLVRATYGEESPEYGAVRYISLR